MKKSLSTALLLLILIIFTAPNVFAQDQLDELRRTANTYYQQGDLLKAVETAEKAVEIAKKEYGDRYNQTLKVMLELANLYLEQRALNQAELVAQEILKLRQEPDKIHFDAKVVLSKVKFFGKEFSEAEKILIGIITSQQGILNQGKEGQVHSLEKSDLDDSKRELGYFYTAKGDYQKAENLYLDMIKAIRDGDNFFNKYANYSALGKFYLDSNQEDKAAPTYEKMIVMWSQYMGPQHVSNHTLMMELSDIYYSLEKFDQSEKKLQEALKFTEMYSDGPLEKSGSRKYFTVVKLGNFYYHRKRLQDAISHYERALTLSQKVFDKTDPECHRMMTVLGTVNQEIKNYDKAENYFERSLQLSKEMNNSDYTLASKNFLAGLYAKKGLNKKAIALLNEAVALSEKTLGQDHEYTLGLKKDLQALSK